MASLTRRGIMQTAINNNNNNIPPMKPPRASSSSSPKVNLKSDKQQDTYVFQYEDDVFSNDIDGGHDGNGIHCTNTPAITVTSQYTPLGVKVPSSSSNVFTPDLPNGCVNGIPRNSSKAPSPSSNENNMKDRKLAVEKSIAWLRQELMDMRKMDQTLIMQLMNIQMKIHALKTDSLGVPSSLYPLTPTQQPSEDYYFDYTREDDNDSIEDNEELDNDVGLEEETGEPVAWREFQRRLSCRRTFSKRGKMPGIVKTAATS